MNSFENLEAILRGCRPRRPSPRVRRALFETTGAEAQPHVAAGLWAAPLTAAAMLLLSLATAWSPGNGSAAAGMTFAALPPGWEPGTTQVERNAPPRSSFRSTTAGTLTSGFGFLLLRQTNVLAR